ncbi:MAG: nucleotidyltransferase [Pirellulaceae bacterium]|nr:MAG: nucleotidyltransferase [Pirellulaceae bacterium]
MVADQLPVERPLVLVHRHARRGITIAACNRAARRAGIGIGMRLGEAAATGASFEVQDWDAEEDWAALCSLAEQAQRFSPIVGLEQLDQHPWVGRTPHQPQALMLDITGSAHLFGGVHGLVEQAAQWLFDMGYYGRLAVGPTVAAAWALAHAARLAPALTPPTAPSPQTTPPPKQSGKLDTPPVGAEKHAWPVPASRYLIAPPGEEAGWIMPLPPSALRIDHVTSAALRRLGIASIGELEQFPRSGLASRFGQQFIRRLDQTLGREAEPVRTLAADPDWQLTHTLEFPLSDLMTIETVVGQLVDQLAQQLQRAGHGALRVSCTLSGPEHVAHVLTVGLFRPTATAKHLHQLLAGQLEQSARRGELLAVHRIDVQATLTAPLRWRQTHLFAPAETSDRQEIARLIDTLSSRLGRNHVVQIRPHRDAQPEAAFTLRPLTGRRPDGTEQQTVRKVSLPSRAGRAEPSPCQPLRRPTHLLAKPLAIEVMCSAAEPSPMSPLLMRVESRTHRVIEAVGPEQLEGGWWNGPSQRRQYYRVVDSRGDWFWIFFDMNTKNWYLHGWFD